MTTDNKPTVATLQADKASMAAMLQTLQDQLTRVMASKGKKGPAAGPVYGYSIAAACRGMGYMGLTIGQVTHVLASIPGLVVAPDTAKTQRQLGAAALAGTAKNRATMDQLPTWDKAQKQAIMDLASKAPNTGRGNQLLVSQLQQQIVDLTAKLGK